MAHAYTCACAGPGARLSPVGPFGARFGSGDPFRPVNIRAIYDDEDNSAVIVVWDGRGTGTRKPRPGERSPGSRH
jgi:hypothetical protein